MTFITLYNYIDRFRQSKAAVLDEWVSYVDVVEIFKRHEIEPDYFVSLFGTHIFDYYISIIEGKNQLGNCPVMTQYLNFLNNRNVSPDELFSICTHFRKSLTTFTYTAGIASNALHKELNYIADKNLQGVLKRFHAIYFQQSSTCEMERRGLIEAQKIAKIGHWEYDIRENYLFWSDETYRIFGLDPDSFPATYQAFLEHVHPEDVEMVSQTYAQSVQQKSPYHITHRVVASDGSVKHVEERCFHETDVSGAITRSVGTVHDVTEKITAQNELILASQLFSHTNDAVIITDAHNKIEMINESFTSLTGYSIKEIRGHDPKHFSAGWGNDQFYKSMWNDITQKGIWQGEIVDQKKNGEYYVAHLTIINIRNNIGETINYIGITKDITEQKAQEKMITQLAYYDTLTGLPNRDYFRDELKKIIKRYKRDDLTFAILFLDIDDFKWLNDSLGHKYGNQALVEITRRIQEVLEGDAIFSRMGGDEFAVFLPYDSVQQVNSLVYRIMESMQVPLLIKSKAITLSTSIGISLFPESGKEFGILLQAADIALYRAKESGKNHFVYFNHEMNVEVNEHIDIGIQLRHATGNESLSMVYQPKIDTRTGKAYGIEALIRWNDPKLGFVSPDKFIAIAEESHLIHEIGNWVLKQSLAEYAASLKGEHDLIMSVNISGKQLKDPLFVENLSTHIRESGVNPKNIELEITETAIMENIDDIVSVLDEVRALGVLIAIDDFGTGYSSMAYLKKLPIHTIKIDRTFIKDIDIDEDDKAIVEAVHALSTQLKLHTIAEGVETAIHAKTLEIIGIHQIQGYYFSRPLDMEALLGFLGHSEVPDMTEDLALA
jgi:diguanylate cyclase (GGDEF)-like protein/PAS domain S-box-containing protein